MDLLSTIRKTGSRGGVNFSWDEVANSSRRENYLGHSLKAPVGRWQQGKDLNWYAKAGASAANTEETQEEREARERKEELRKIKEAEEDALARALGLPVKQRDTTGANAIEVTGKRQLGRLMATIARDTAEIDHDDIAMGTDWSGTRVIDGEAGVEAAIVIEKRESDGGIQVALAGRSTETAEYEVVRGRAHGSRKVSMMRQPAAIIFGGTRIGNRELFKPETSLESFLGVLRAHNVTTIDTAQAYGNSEATLGQVRAGERFTLDTKWSPPSWTETTPWASQARIIETADESIQRLGTPAGTFYLHKMDPLTPLAETLAGVNEAYRRRRFRRLGLSGFPPAAVAAAHEHCITHGYPPPAVYQGGYNPLSRDKEATLLPTLRRLGVAFHAFSPAAGGFLGKTPAQQASTTCAPYLREERYARALGRWNELAAAEGVGAAEMAYRWMAHHSALDGARGDALVIGASSPEQLEETLTGIAKGPLSEEACAGIQEIWETLRTS